MIFMAILNEDVLKQIKEKMSELKDPVKILYFKPDKDCDHCSQIEEILKEVCSIDDKISVETHSEKDEKAKEYEIDITPAIVVEGKEKRFVRYFGMPSGYEFATFITDIVDVSKNETHLPQEIADEVKKIDFPLRMMVFVTPTCPYCPGAVKLAHDFALLNPNIKGDMISAVEFRELSEKHGVMGVPKTVLNEKVSLEGAYPADVILKKIQELKK